MFCNIHYGSSSQQNVISVFRVQEQSAWLIDGADPFFPMHITEEESDGKWYVSALSRNLKQQIGKMHLTLSEAVAQSMQEVQEEYQGFTSNQTLYDLQKPCASGAIIRLEKGFLHYFVLGNCAIMFTMQNGEKKVISDLRLPLLDAKLLEVLHDCRYKKRMPLFQTKNFFQEMLVENRLCRNVEDGYYVLGDDIDAIHYAKTGHIPVQDIRTITLISNGFSQYMNHPKIMNQIDKYIYKTRSEEVVETYHASIRKKKDNVALAHYMQEKLSEKAAVVFFDVATPMQLGKKETQKTK